MASMAVAKMIEYNGLPVIIHTGIVARDATKKNQSFRTM